MPAENNILSSKKACSAAFFHSENKRNHALCIAQKQNLLEAVRNTCRKEFPDKLTIRPKLKKLYPHPDEYWNQHRA